MSRSGPVNNRTGPFLIVDDEPDICWTLERILKAAGGICHTALTVKEALALAKHHIFHAAFLDAKLPDGDGLTLARWLREADPHIRIVLVSGYFYQDDPVITDAVQTGLVAAFIAKPFAHHDILRAIGRQHAAGNSRP